MTNIKIPGKYQKLWKKCLPLLKKSRPGDDEHAKEVVDRILNYTGKLKLNYDIIIPAAMMHDIGHSAILPKHFKFITGPKKIKNGKLAHMLVGAKIADDILKSIKYDKKKSREIVEIISMHDADQLSLSVGLKKIYNSDNKKIFHDFDTLDRYNDKRLKNLESIYPDKEELLKVLKGMLDLFFYKEIRKLAEQWIDKIYENRS